MFLLPQDKRATWGGCQNIYLTGKNSIEIISNKCANVTVSYDISNLWFLLQPILCYCELHFTVCKH